MFDILTGRITVLESTKRYDFAPNRGDRVTVHVETFDMKRFVLEGLIVECELRGAARRSRGTGVEVGAIWVLVVEPDGAQSLGRFQRDGETETEIQFRTRNRLRRIEQLPSKDRDRATDYLIGIAESAAKRREHDVVVANASRVLELDAQSAKARFLRATAYAELADHERALADWDRYLASQPDHAPALHGRARTRYALGLRADALVDARRALAGGIEGAMRLIELLEPPRAPSNTVRHKTYGDGTIVRRLEGDKLEIQFAAGKKTLLAKFVELV